LAIQNILPKFSYRSDVHQDELCGHHGNPIVLVEAKLTNRAAFPSLLEKIGSSLSSLDKEELAAEIAQHVERQNLYFAIQQTKCIIGDNKLGHDDPIRFKIHFKNKTFEEIINLCKQAGLLHETCLLRFTSAGKQPKINR